MLEIIKILSKRTKSVIEELVLIIKWNKNVKTTDPPKKTNKKPFKFLSVAITPTNKPEIIIIGSVNIAINPPNKLPIKPEFVAIPKIKIKTFADKIAEGIIHNLFISAKPYLKY